MEPGVDLALSSPFLWTVEQDLLSSVREIHSYGLWNPIYSLQSARFFPPIKKR